MIEAYYKSLRCANVIGVLHDVTNRHTKDNLHKDVVTILKENQDVPSFLIMNKVRKTLPYLWNNMQPMHSMKLNDHSHLER